MALKVMSPLVADRIWALPIGAAAVKFLQYLVFKSEDGGALPSQRHMAREYRVTPSTISALMEPLFEANLVLRSRGEERGGNRYKLHPLACKYGSMEEMETAFAAALADMKTGKLPGINLPEYQTVPPAEGAQPDLRIA
jgi:DNA-binding transcriptional ArsR family regulator